MELNIDTHVKSVARSLMLLDLMAEKRSPLSLKDISIYMNWPKSTVHGILTTLRDFGYVTQSETDGKYALGIRLFELGNVLQSTWDIHNIASPVMVKLNAMLGETVHLATEDKGEVLYLEKIDSHHLLRIVSQVGCRLPMYCTGVGKVLLAYKNDRTRDRLIKLQAMQPYTSRTITDVNILKKELSLIKERGYAYDNGEIMDGLHCIAVPVFNNEGKVLYALSVSGLGNMDQSRIETITRALLTAGSNISKGIGFRGEFR